VHCGETVASFFLQGIFDFLVSANEQSQLLLNNFVFKIIPVLNPDGVSRGYWR
jgi:murein tripeptide amidase MpaA